MGVNARRANAKFCTKAAAHHRQLPRANTTTPTCHPNGCIATVRHVQFKTDMHFTTMAAKLLSHSYKQPTYEGNGIVIARRQGDGPDTTSLTSPANYYVAGNNIETA